jgi:hypothetical protein
LLADEFKISSLTKTDSMTNIGDSMISALRRFTGQEIKELPSVEQAEYSAAILASRQHRLSEKAQERIAARGGVVGEDIIPKLNSAIHQILHGDKPPDIIPEKHKTGFGKVQKAIQEGFGVIKKLGVNPEAAEALAESITARAVDHAHREIEPSEWMTKESVERLKEQGREDYRPTRADFIEDSLKDKEDRKLIPVFEKKMKDFAIDEADRLLKTTPIDPSAIQREARKEISLLEAEADLAKRKAKRLVLEESMYGMDYGDEILKLKKRASSKLGMAEVLRNNMNTAFLPKAEIVPLPQSKTKFLPTSRLTASVALGGRG